MYKTTNVYYMKLHTCEQMHLHWQQRVISNIPFFLQLSKRLSSVIASNEFKWVSQSLSGLTLASSKSSWATALLTIAIKGLQNILGRSRFSNISCLTNVRSKGRTKNYFRGVTKALLPTLYGSISKGIWIYMEYNIHTYARTHARTHTHTHTHIHTHIHTYIHTYIHRNLSLE